MPERGGPGGRVRVFVRLASLADDELARLAGSGAIVETVDASRGIVQALVEASRLREIAELPSVVSLRPVERGRLRTGAVDGEGDAAARADLARGLGYDGTGTVVGVISDGIDHLAEAQSSGDLPAVVVPPDARCGAGSGDEGTALLEIVHDLAPGAPLLFSEGVTSSLSFIDSVSCLVAAGARVIVDDIGFFDEPFFADGPVAAAVRNAVQAGVSFHSAAGNSGTEHVLQLYRKSPNDFFHDFGSGVGPVDGDDDMVVPPGGVVICFLQWDDPFGASANDYDLAIFNAASQLVAASTNVQNGTQDPIEAAGVINGTNAPQVAKVRIEKASGADRLLEMFCLGGVNQQYVTGDSIFGHSAVPEVVAVAAIDVGDPGRDDVETFSSRGPRLIAFPALHARDKPDVAGFDGVSITNAGGFPDCPPSCRFFGTSAAAPHSAAVAALLLSKNPFLLPADILDVLHASAVDLGPIGFDEASGAGRLDAFNAVAMVPVPECFTSTTCDDGDPCTDDACSRGTCIHSPTGCDDGDACNGEESCAPSIGCVAGTPPACADGDPCTTDGCDPAAGCRSTELPGLSYVSCALAERLAPLIPEPPASPRGAKAVQALLARLARAERNVTKAPGAKPARARQRLARARHALAALTRLAHRRESDLGATIVRAIVLESRAIASRIRSVQRTL